MDEHAIPILEALTNAGIEHDAGSLLKYHSQGIMSSVYTVRTPSGDLIIHLAKLTPALEYFRVWEKLKPVSKFLRAISGIPAAEVIFTVKWPGHFLAVQRKLPGKSAGTVELKNNDIVLTWEESPDLFGEQMVNIAANIHTAPLEGFGPFVADDSGLQGKYDSWREFLTTDVPFWLEGVSKADRARNSEADSVIKDSHDFLGRVIEHIAPLQRASLVNSDMMNPSNILIEHGRITGVIDWEWSLAADPAWEFAYTNPFPLTRYFARFPELSTERARKDFLERSQIYTYILFMMWSFAISGDPMSDFFEVSRGRLKRKMAGADEFLKSIGL